VWAWGSVQVEAVPCRGRTQARARVWLEVKGKERGGINGWLGWGRRRADSASWATQWRGKKIKAARLGFAGGTGERGGRCWAGPK
jgi:hypothetical protein